MKTTLNRKALLIAVVLSLAIAVGLAGCPPRVQRVEADVVVIGGGGAGLAAAVSAAEQGAKVVLLEKLPRLGGNTILAGGAYNAADPERQRAQGIEDSVEKHFEHTFKGGGEIADPALVRLLVENALEGKKWLEGYGMKFREEVGSVIGAMWPRTNYPVDPAGTGFIKTLEAAATKLGVDIRLETTALELVQDSGGRVTGVKAEGPDKRPMQFNARRGVVIATGGFGANVEMRQKYDPRLTTAVPTTNHPGATGAGITMAEKLGADIIGMEYIQVLTLGNLTNGSLGGLVTINVDNVVFVNKEGERFANEFARRDLLAELVFNQTEGMFYMVNDSKIVGEKNHFGENIEALVERGSILKADTLANLALQMEVPAEALEKTVADFNRMVAEKNDPEFGRTVFAQKIDTAPFYAVARVPSVHHTMGGIRINDKAQVLKKDGSSIPGLYAAGEVTGGIHGNNRLGGNALPDIIVFGRIAGKNVAAERP